MRVAYKLSVNNFQKFKVANANFCESMWLEVIEPLKDICLVNISYNPSKNFSDFLLNDLSAELSNAYSLTENLPLFCDYSLDQFKKKEILDNFKSGLEVNPTNVDTPTRISRTNQSLNDHCFMTTNQIVEWRVCLPLIEVDHNIIFYQSNLEMTGMNEDKYNLKKHTNFPRGEFQQKFGCCRLASYVSAGKL